MIKFIALVGLAASTLSQWSNCSETREPKKPLEVSTIPEMVAIPEGILSQGIGRKISRTEVTWAQYLASVENGPCAIPRNVIGKKYILAELPRDNFPVTGINLNDATCYADWLGKQVGRSFRLPTSNEYDELYNLTGIANLEAFLRLSRTQVLPFPDARLPIGNLRVEVLPLDKLGLQGLSDNALEFTSTVVSGKGPECFPRTSPCKRVAIRGRLPGAPLSGNGPAKGTLYFTDPETADAGAGFRVIQD